MRDPSPRAPFDQGLFLKHFNKGKDLYDQKKFDEAEMELEEAYLLRPRDQRVLNLLGLVYFKQEKYEKAEEVYRKLTAESPDVNTLHYNLGLIYFKLSRLEEAESCFLKALELLPENAKINFYLGSIYERLHRFQDAIYQYRQAGANIMVRRVEGKMATRPATPNTAAPATRPRRPDDTAEFKAREIREGLRRRKTEETLPPKKALLPVSPSLMAEGAAPAPTQLDTASRRTTESTLPPTDLAARLPEMFNSPPPGTSPSGERLPANRGTEAFRFLERNLLEVSVSGKVFIKQGSIYSYGGNLTFWVKEKRGEGNPALVIITGTGKVILTDKDRGITLTHVEDATIHVEPSHLLACEETLTPRYVTVRGSTANLEFLALEGTGMVALSVASKPLPLTVTADLPVSVPSSSIITWSGALSPHVLDDRQLYEVMLPPNSHAGLLVRLEGSGRLLVEQALTQ